MGKGQEMDETIVERVLLCGIFCERGFLNRELETWVSGNRFPGCLVQALAKAVITPWPE